MGGICQALGYAWTCIFKLKLIYRQEELRMNRPNPPIVLFVLNLCKSFR